VAEWHSKIRLARADAKVWGGGACVHSNEKPPHTEQLIQFPDRTFRNGVRRPRGLSVDVNTRRRMGVGIVL